MSNATGFSISDINFLSRSFQQSRVFLTGFELGVFTVLGDEEKTSARIADEIDAEPRAADRLLNALCATGALLKKDNKFLNSDAAKKYLVKSSPDYQAGIMHSVNLWKSWSDLTDSVLIGGPLMESNIDERDDAWFKPFIAAMHSRAFKEAPDLVKEIDLKGVKKVLDVGGGSGAYSMAFVREGEGICSTVFDLPNVTALTQNYIKEAGLEAKIDTASGDYNRDEFPSGYDLAFLSAIIHINSPEQNVALVKRVSRALNPGGKIVISDFIMDDDRTSPPFGAFFALNMLVNTECGDTYTESEIKEWLKEAGMEFVERKQTKNTGLITGKKI